MKGPAVDHLLYNTLFPQPKSSDPPNFAAFLSRHLIPEVRLETACFYGDLSTREAQYPGLNYMYSPHRTRLSRFPWHRRLFRAIDSLALTENEVLSLTRWEGTLWARRRFERENAVCVKDTTGDEVREWVPGWTGRSAANVSDADTDADADAAEQDVELQTLDARLGAAVSRRQLRAPPGDAALLAMTEEWEQWLKETSENGGDISSAPEQIIHRLIALRDSSMTTGGLPDYLGLVVRGAGNGNGNRSAAASQDVDVLPRREEGREAVPDSRREEAAREYARFMDPDTERHLQIQLLQNQNIARLRAIRERSSQGTA